MDERKGCTMRVLEMAAGRGMFSNGNGMADGGSVVRADGAEA
jgi:hypothetical protein